MQVDYLCIDSLHNVNNKCIIYLKENCIVVEFQRNDIMVENNRPQQHKPCRGDLNVYYMVIPTGFSIHFCMCKLPKGHPYGIKKMILILLNS